MADGSLGTQVYLPDLDREQLVIGFAGGGGSSNAARKAYGRDPDVAINHDPDAIKMHAANHPGCLHLQDDIRSVDFTWAIPRGPVEMAWLSPSCQHFSKALGGKPKSEQRRALCDVAIPLMRERKPRLVIIENVAEWGDWGPLGADGKPIKAELGAFFRDFVGELRAQGYAVDWRVLDSADYGMATFRKRLYLVARRDAAPAWPAPTHGPGRRPYRAAATILDFSLPCPSIFDYRRGEREGHAPATQARIARGFIKFVLEREPFVVGDAAFFGVVKGYGERPGQAPRIWDLEQPLPTIVAGGIKQRLCVVWLRKDNRGATGQPVTEPVHTITCKDTKRLMVVPFGQDVETPERVRTWFAEWLPGIRPVVPIGGTDYPIADLGARILTPRELHGDAGRVLAIPGRRLNRSHLAERLREDLRTAGVTRPELFAATDQRMRMRAHDLRATFVTIALAAGRSETWISDRTGHRSSTMIRTYHRAARRYAAADLVALAPLGLALPELRLPQGVCPKRPRLTSRSQNEGENDACQEGVPYDF